MVTKALRVIATVLASIWLLAACGGGSGGTQTVTVAVNTGTSVAEQATMTAYQRLYYGESDQQFFDVRLPLDQPGPYPVAVLIHGGCWQKSVASYIYFDPLAEDMTERGYATVNLEYRAVDDDGGGWPGTFEDVAFAIDSLRTLVDPLQLDLSHLVFAGHSAGGHLALWAASRGNLTPEQPLWSAEPLLPAVAVGLAAITDLDAYLQSGRSCGGVIPALIGADQSDPAYSERLQQTSPTQLFPATRSTLVVNGDRDGIVPVSQASFYALQQSSAGIDSPILVQAGAGHFDIIDTGLFYWQQTFAEMERLLAIHGGGGIVANREQ